MRKCIGCGAVLQSENKSEPGYTPKPEGGYCQRCFRLIHYDDLTVSMRTGIDPDTVISQASAMDALILWVIDLFDNEAGMIPGINRKLSGKDIILALNKRDLLPENISDEKIMTFIAGRLGESGIRVREMIMTSREHNLGAEEIKEAVEMYAGNRPVVVIGRANSGKSTLMNRLAGRNDLTMSRYPGTTLDFNEIVIDGRTYIDTPGIEIENSILMAAEEKDLKTIIPQKTIKPVVYQLKDDQSFAAGGLVRLDLYGCHKASCVWYVSSALMLHRSKASNADMLWKNHYGETLVPVPQKKEFSSYSIRKDEGKTDIVIDGLGWACVSGEIRTITVHVPKGVNVTFRKAML